MTKRSRYLTIAQAADELGISVQRVGQLVKAKKLGKPTKIQCGYRKIAHLERSKVEARKLLAVPPKETP